MHLNIEYWAFNLKLEIYRSIGYDYDKKIKWILTDIIFKILTS
jgi:hypothetical protein